jgi:hypothetical protein
MERGAREHLMRIFDELLAHDGFGELRVEFRLLKRGQKEVIVHCDRQRRFVLDFAPATRLASTTPGGSN